MEEDKAEEELRVAEDRKQTARRRANEEAAEAERVAWAKRQAVCRAYS